MTRPLRDLLAINSHDKPLPQTAKELGLGLEIEDFAQPLAEEELLIRRESAPRLMEGFAKFSFHGAIVRYDKIAEYPQETLFETYAKSYDMARSLGIAKIVFHANYVAGREAEEPWIRHQALFWKRFVRERPEAWVYIENFVDETPYLMARLCDAVDDPRFALCLDAGHAACNSPIPVADWIGVLGMRVGHAHLHNNDGAADRHWPLGRGVLDDRDVIERLLAHTACELMVLECAFEESLLWLRARDML